MSLREDFILAAFGLVLCTACMPAVAAQSPTPAAGHAQASANAKEAARSDAVFHALDTNKDGVLSPQEFRVGYAGIQQRIALELSLREQFHVLDTDHNGSINAAEYAQLVLVKRAGASAPALAAFDADKNGALDFAEYVTAVRQLARLHPASPASSWKKVGR